VQRAAVDAQAATNPVILVEVTSRSTEDDDRGEKPSHYKQLPSLRAVLFVSHKTPRVTLVERSGTGWLERELRAGETVTITAPAASISVDELYRGVSLDD
jgi:Uma2 family endonuclease